LLMFGVVALENQLTRGRMVVVISGAVWLICFVLLKVVIPEEREAHQVARTLARYFLCFPGGLLAAYGLRYQAQRSIAPLNIRHIYRVLRIAGWSLIAYAVFAGLLVRPGNFFPANVLNLDLIENTLGLPIEVLRSLTGLVLAVTLIRVLEVFEIELDQMIEGMEIERIQAAERDRIGQEIHDGAIQGVYSASLILESVQPLLEADSESSRRVQQARSVLNAVNMDLRSYMVSLRAQSPPDPLIPSLKTLIANPRFHGLLDIDLTYDVEPQIKPTQVHHVLAIIQESLSNTLRHARASRAQIAITRSNGSVDVHIEDDGRGFSSQTTPPSYGLRSMRDRARLLGGQLEVESQPGKGTRVILRLPEERAS
ncbi:MAG: sensor histidine kinase, partial [Anaerolineae bacterium]|nr:sensor histidine kinase [Anaerolineae bacterium]